MKSKFCFYQHYLITLPLPDSLSCCKLTNFCSIFFQCGKNQSLHSLTFCQTYRPKDDEKLRAQEGGQDADQGLPHDDGREVRGEHLAAAQRRNPGNSTKEQFWPKFRRALQKCLHNGSSQARRTTLHRTQRGTSRSCTCSNHIRTRIN